MIVNDTHCHFFSTRFFAALGRQVDASAPEPEQAALAKLGWEAPGSAEELADRWTRELDRAGVRRATLIASVPGDAESVGIAVKRHPDRFVGWFMVDPTAPDLDRTLTNGLGQLGLRGV